MLCGSGKGEVMRVVQRWVDHDKVQSFKVKRREGHRMVNVHEGSFKEGVGRCYVNFMRVVQRRLDFMDFKRRVVYRRFNNLR